MKATKLLASLLSAAMAIATVAVPSFAEDIQDKYDGFVDFETAVKDKTVTSVEAIAGEDVSTDDYTIWQPEALDGNSTYARGKYGTLNGENIFVVWKYQGSETNPYITSKIKIDGVEYRTVIDMTDKQYNPFFRTGNTPVRAKLDSGIDVTAPENFFYNNGLKTLDLPTTLVSKLNLPSNLDWAYFNAKSEQYETYTIGGELTGYTADRVTLQGANTSVRTLTYYKNADKETAKKQICAWFNIIVDPNGGVCDGKSEAYTAIEGISKNTTLNVLPTRNDYVFDGWTVGNDDINKSVTLTAKWAKAPCQHKNVTEVVIKDSTCTEEGSKTLTCNDCNNIENVTIPKKPHDYTEEIVKAATCTDSGSKKFTCKNCSNIKIETIDALGHDFVNGTCTRCQVEKAMEASIGGIKYDTLQEAIDAAKDGDEIVLLENIDKDVTYTIDGKKLTLELNGKSISANVNGAVISVVGKSDVTVKDSVGGSVITEEKPSYSKAIWMKDSALEVIGGTYVGYGAYGGIQTSGGTLKVTDAKFENRCSYGNVFTVNGGTVATLENVTVSAANGADGLWVEGGNVTVKSGVYCTAYTAKNGSTLEILGGTFESTVGAAYNRGTIAITGGTFAKCQFELPTGDTVKLIDYVLSGYTVQANGDKFCVVKSEAKVIDTSRTTGVEVTLNGLERHENVDTMEDATYKVVISTASQKDVETANKAIKENADDNNTNLQILDISVVKIDRNGVQTDISKDITDQKVTLTLSEEPVGDVIVYHVNDAGTVDFTTTVTPVGKTVTFTAPSFSVYAYTYTPAAVAADDITAKVVLSFEKVTDNQYDIVLNAESGKIINRFMSADLVFANNSTGIAYEITPAANVTASRVIENGNSTEYHFEMNGTVASSVSGETVTIGTVTFSGVGHIDFSVDTAFASEHAINIVNTAKVDNNIVDNYTVADDTLDVTATVDAELKAETKKLTINITFPNAVTDNKTGYQDMTVTIAGGETNETFKLGTDGEAMENGAYKITKDLTENTPYTVTVSGAGYRTARYTVTLNGDKTLNFWNNVKDTAVSVEKDNTNSAKNVTFLAGDIVKDNVINIYDLSAVVSYFGESGLSVSNKPEYAKYDLNRDGKIDSKDVAYVLVSWGK